jgi:GT2 family glycosyltransferase
MRFSKTCVICVNYRGSVDTANCVRSLLTSLTPVRIVVVDTTPNDPRLRVALEFAPNVALLRARTNIGYGRANNLGIAWALKNTSCEFIFLLNNDTVVYPHTVAILEDAMKLNVDADILSPRIAFLHEPDKLWYGGGEMDWRRASAYVPGFGGDAHAPSATTERDVTFASGCALFMRRSVVAKLGGFDSRFFMYEEDVELCLRARAMGVRIRYIPRSLVLHRAQGSSRGTATERGDFWSCDHPGLTFYAYHVMRNRVLNIRLHARGRQRMIAVVCFPMLLARRAVPFLLGGRTDAIKAMLGGVRDSMRMRLDTQVKLESEEATETACSQVAK